MDHRILSFLLGPVRKPGRLLKYAALSAGIIAATVLLEELLLFIGMENVQLVMLYILSTFLIARLTTGYLISLAAAVVNTFLYDYFVTAPRLGFSFTIGLPVTLMVMLVVSIITSAATTQMKDRMASVQRQERETELMLEICQRMGAAESMDRIVQIAVEYLSLHGMSGVFYKGDPLECRFAAFCPDGGEPPAVTPAETMAAHAFFAGLKKGAAGGEQHPCDPRYFPVVSNGVPLGIIAVTGGGKPPDKDRWAMVRVISGQTALAMELQYVTDERTETLMLAEKEKTRSNLLRAISHDLRTPLTGILSASTILEEKTGDKMAAGIREDSEWLIHMVENLLMVTRISDGENQIIKKPELAEEVMARSVGIVRKRFPLCQLHVKAPKELVIVPMDATLISQVFINLLENAAKYSPPKSMIFFDMDVRDATACFTVSDSGEGIPENLLDNLFGQHTPGSKKSVDSVNGMGLGLSICKTIVEAHGGSIKGKNKIKGGAMFTVYLPLGIQDYGKPGKGSDC